MSDEEITQQQQQLPHPFTYSIKVEETVKGLRIGVHVYRNNEDESIESALRTYEKTISKFMDHSHTMAPMRWRLRLRATEFD